MKIGGLLLNISGSYGAELPGSAGVVPAADLLLLPLVDTID